MKTDALPHPSPSLFGPSTLAPAAVPGEPARGRPSKLDERTLEALCAVIRETGTSDTGAASQVGVHPSTVSRWKRNSPDLVILLRSAREEFRLAQLSIIMGTAQAGRPTSWRAAAWLLERIFPQDYSPRAAERAKFQERYDAICASEEEGAGLACTAEGEPLQNVQNASNHQCGSPSSKESGRPRSENLDHALMTNSGRGRPDSLEEAAPSVDACTASEPPLQNVQKAPLAGAICPPALNRTAVGVIADPWSVQSSVRLDAA